VKDAILQQQKSDEINLPTLYEQEQNSDGNVSHNSSLYSQSPINRTKKVALEILVPIRKVIQQITLEVGKKFIIGRELIPKEIQGRDSVSATHVSIQLLDQNQLIIEDLSSYGTGAANYSGKSFDTTTLSKNIPVAFKFPIIVNLAGMILLGIY
jgi:hypothetical protein